MKRVLSLLLAVAMLFMLTACKDEVEQPTFDPNAAPQIGLGIILPETGEYAIWGKEFKQGADLAIKEINEAGGLKGKDLVATYIDDQGSKETAAIKYTEVKENLHGFIGAITSDVTADIATLCDTDFKYLLIPFSGGEDLTFQRAGVNRICNNDEQQGTILARYAVGTLNANSVAILYDNANPYSLGLMNKFRMACESDKLRIEVKGIEAYMAGRDCTSEVQRALATSPDVLFVPDYFVNAAEVIKTARKLGYTGPILGSDGLEDIFEVVDEADVAAFDNVHFPSHINTGNSKSADFVNNYKAKYGEEPSSLAALGYDAVKIFAMATTESTSLVGSDIMAAMIGMLYEGVTGKIEFDNNGDTKKSLNMMKCENGKSVYQLTIEPFDIGV